MDIIVLLGAPGCGKGTQAEIIERSIGYKKFSTGDMLREMASSASPLAEELNIVMKAGKLVSDELIIKIIGERLSNLGDVSGVILDGFPRTIMQAKSLELLLNNFKKIKLRYIYIEVKEESLIKRVTGRFSCGDCLSGYHDEFKPLKKEGICDNCGSSNFVRREDDNEVTVKNRLEQYDQDTLPIIKLYEDKGILQRVDGNQSMDLVYSSLKNLL